MIDDSSTEWVTESSESYFQLHWIKGLALCATLCRHIFGITFIPLFEKCLIIKCNLCQRLWPLLSQSIPSPWVWLLVHVRICVFVNTLVSLFSIEGYFCGCANSGQIWAGEFDTKCSYILFWFFCRNKFCCKMHMQKFCTEVTILPAAVEPWPAFLAWKKFSIEIWSL